MAMGPVIWKVWTVWYEQCYLKIQVVKKKCISEIFGDKLGLREIKEDAHKYAKYDSSSVKAYCLCVYIDADQTLYLNSILHILR